MKNVYLPLIISCIAIILSCEDKDTTPPDVEVLNLENGLHVYGKVLIEVDSWDKEGVEYVELLVDENLTGVTDSIEPYILEWNTDDYELGVAHLIQCRSYDTHGNYQDSESFDIFVDITFVKSFSGGGGIFLMENVQQTTDGGYILTGRKEEDVWLIKTDQYGHKEWDQTFGGNFADQGTSVKQTTDGGFIITGQTWSYGNGNSDVWLVKTDGNGTEEWNKTFGGSDRDWGDVVQQTYDGGYIIAGGTKSYAVDNNDVWLIKTDGTGNEEWNKTFGNENYNAWRTSVQQTADGGYITYMGTFSLEGNWDDVILIKLNADGNEEWSSIFGGPDDDWFFDIKQTTDGGYIATGVSVPGKDNTWLVKIESNGSLEWEKTFEGSVGLSVDQTLEGGFIVSGYKHESGSNFMINLIKIDVFGNVEWTKTYPGKEGNAVQQTTDGGYIISGLDDSGILLIKTNAEGNATKYVDVIE